MNRKHALRSIVPLLLILPGTCLLHGDSAGEGQSKPASVASHRPANPLLGTRRALVMMVSHASLKPSAVDAGRMKQLMEGVREIYAAASNNTFQLESVVLPEPILLPGNCSDYDLSRVKDLYAAANREALQKHGSGMDPDTFDALIYFFPRDTNGDIFGMGRWNSTFGLRFTPAVVNIGTATSTRPEAIAHELGHAFFWYAHAASANPKTGEVLRWAGDLYELMGYGRNRNLINPPHLGMAYRYYWGWIGAGEITPIAGPTTARLDPGRALLVPTSENNLLWIEIITAEQAYEDETGGLLVRVDRSGKNGIYHATLDMIPETEFQPDMHLTPGQSIEFEGRKITYASSFEIENCKTPGAAVKVEGSGPWVVPKGAVEAAHAAPGIPR